jgi:hypothetical protein
LLLAGLVTSCGYRIPQAKLQIDVDAERSASTVEATLEKYLTDRGYEAVEFDVRSRAMLKALVEAKAKAKAQARVADSADDYEPYDRQIDEMTRKTSYRKEGSRTSIEVIDYSSVRFKKSVYWDGPEQFRPDTPAVEVTIYENRPGGFSDDGFAVYQDLSKHLATSFGIQSVHEVEPARRESDLVLFAMAAAIGLGNSLWWLGAVLLPLLILVPLEARLLPWVPWSISVKRTVVTVINTWLTTPLPFPVASILVAFLPHIFAFPWTDDDYYRRVSTLLWWSFPVAALINYGVARRFIR